jgi:hypothetical protein
MPEIRHILTGDSVEALWNHKDTLSLLSEDPLRMYKGKFVQYLEVKADQSLADYLALGMTHDEAMAKTRADLTAITAEWKEEAKRRHQ